MSTNEELFVELRVSSSHLDVDIELDEGGNKMLFRHFISLEYSIGVFRRSVDLVSEGMFSSHLKQISTSDSLFFTS